MFLLVEATNVYNRYLIILVTENSIIHNLREQFRNKVSLMFDGLLCELQNLREITKYRGKISKDSIQEKVAKNCNLK
jgi:hypothetical protein